MDMMLNVRFGPIADIAPRTARRQNVRVAVDPQPWPPKLSREERRWVKQRGKEFQTALKAEGRRRGWRYAGGELFQQDGEWFASVLPFLQWERGAVVRFSLKPMRLEPLFWDIVGLPENNGLPLSFRANGAWVLRPPAKERRVGPAMSEVTALAELVASSADEQLRQSRDTRSTGQMLRELTHAGPVVGHQRALAICLHILGNDLDGALDLCRAIARKDISDTGGFATVNPDGTASTFLEQAEGWIIAKRRSAMRLV
jgi:hypothetical protein